MVCFSSCRTSNRKSLIGSGQSAALPRPHSPLSSHTGNLFSMCICVFMCARLALLLWYLKSARLTQLHSVLSRCNMIVTHIKMVSSVSSMSPIWVMYSLKKATQCVRWEGFGFFQRTVTKQNTIIWKVCNKAWQRVPQPKIFRLKCVIPKVTFWWWSIYVMSPSHVSDWLTYLFSYRLCEFC